MGGTLELEPLLWQVPPLNGRATLLARDLGPVENALLLAAHPERTPWILVWSEGRKLPRLIPYGEGMERLWGVGAPAG